MNCPILLHFLQNSWKKSKKTGTKIECDVLGCIALTGWILRFYPVFPEFTQKTENRGEDWLWKAMMYPTCGINGQIIFHLRDELLELIPFFSNSLNKLKIRVKIEYCKSCYNHSNCHDLPRFSKVNCTNRGKDWKWKSYDIIHLKDELSQLTPCF